MKAAFDCFELSDIFLKILTKLDMGTRDGTRRDICLQCDLSLRRCVIFSVGKRRRNERSREVTSPTCLSLLYYTDSKWYLCFLSRCYFLVFFLIIYAYFFLNLMVRHSSLVVVNLMLRHSYYLTSVK